MITHGSLRVKSQRELKVKNQSNCLQTSYQVMNGFSFVFEWLRVPQVFWTSHIKTNAISFDAQLKIALTTTGT